MMCAHHQQLIHMKLSVTLLLHLHNAYVWKCTINANKTVAMCFGRSGFQPRHRPIVIDYMSQHWFDVHHYPPRPPPPLVIKWVKECKYLGLHYQSNMSWLSHNNHITTKAREASFMICSIFPRGNTHSKPGPLTVRLLIMAIIIPIISYVCPSLHYMPALSLSCCVP
jgi:hypothetical protein